MARKKKCTEHEEKVIIECLHKMCYYQRLQMLLWVLAVLILIAIIYFYSDYRVFSYILIFPLLVSAVGTEISSRKKHLYGKVWKKNRWKVVGVLADLLENIDWENENDFEKPHKEDKKELPLPDKTGKE